MNHDAILFDAAETLFTTKSTVGEIYHALAQRYGSLATAEEIQQAFQREFQHSGPLSTQSEQAWWRDVVHRVFLDVGMVENFEEFFAEVYDQFRDARVWRLFPETRSVLDRLRQAGLKLGVVSNFDSRLYTVLNDLQILDAFATITISSETGYAKPQPEIFAAAVQAAGVAPNRVLFTGDNLMDDYQAAREAGLDAYLLDRSGRYADIQKIRRIASLQEILVIAGIG
jgi:putative hydrolase of the HAD superfamily